MIEINQMNINCELLLERDGGVVVGELFYCDSEKTSLWFRYNTEISCQRDPSSVYQSQIFGQWEMRYRIEKVLQ